MKAFSALSHSERHEIWKTRDATYDGQFFGGVVTTGIYCRPICPARTPLSKNIQFYLMALDAESAGFRACLRCRPETAPGTPAWLGTETTVARALRLMKSGWVRQHGLVALSERLGVSDRQIRRLFQKHLGKSPLKAMKEHE